MKTFQEYLEDVHNTEVIDEQLELKDNQLEIMPSGVVHGTIQGRPIKNIDQLIAGFKAIKRDDIANLIQANLKILKDKVSGATGDMPDIQILGDGKIIVTGEPTQKQINKS